jgi:hypothetical protein
MFLMFIIGLLLIITTFFAYYKLDNTCKSDALRIKLRLAISLGTMFATIAIGYMICLTKKAYKCDVSRSNLKTYTMLTLFMVVGGGLLALTIGIKNDIKKTGCKIDLGIIPSVLMGLSIAQMVIPVLYMIYITVKKDDVNKSQDSVSEEEEEDDDDSLAMKSKSLRGAIDDRRRARYKKNIAKNEADLSVVRDKIEQAKSRGKSNYKDKEKRDLLVAKLKTENRELSEIGSSVGGDDDSNSNSNSNSDNNMRWLLGGK